MNEDFYGSIDKLIEFGMSGKVAEAMMNAMNNAMQRMQMPNYTKVNQINMVENPVQMPSPNPKRFYVGINNVPVGPLDIEEMKQRALEGEITPNSLVWYEGLPGWAKVSQLEEIKNILPPAFPKP